MPARTAKEREVFMSHLKSELPALIYYLLNEHIIRKEIADLEEERMGVRGYHDQYAMEYVDSYSNDGSRLFSIIDCLRQYYDPQKDSWRGNSSALLKFLKSRGVEQMATPTSIGRFLNQRIESGCKWVKSVGHREYEIKLIEGSTDEVESKETEQTQDEIIEMSESDHDFDEDAPYGRYNGTTD